MQPEPRTSRESLVFRNRDSWVARLIDTSRRNNLLYLRTESKGQLRLGAGDEEALTELIAEGKARLSDWFDDDLLIEPSARLKDIVRNAKSNEEERGLSTLFLALQLVSWPSTDGGRPTAAPLVMVPISVERHQGTARDWILTLCGEPNLNISLLQVLRKDLHLDTAKLEAAFDESLDADGALTPEGLATLTTLLQNAAVKVPDFTVAPSAIIGNFSFAKMSLVQDLLEAGQALVNHTFVAALSGDPEAMEALRANMKPILPSEVDRVPPSNDFTFLPADSSQLAAIQSVLQGQDGVIQGPPGTGKSQTIANLIAELVGRGKRVLFVAEKRAAIQVVADRLTSHGLGSLLLDLHGSDIRRKEVMEKLQKGLDAIRNAPLPPADGHLARLEELTGRLNAHPRVLHTPLDPWKLSPFQIMEGALKTGLNGRLPIRFPGPVVARLLPQRVQELCDLLVEAASVECLFLGSDPSPWMESHDLTPSKVTETVDLLEDLLRVLVEHRTAMEGLAGAYGLPTPNSLSESFRLFQLAKRLEEFKKNYPASMVGGDINSLAGALAPGLKGPLGRLIAFVTDGDFRTALKETTGRRRSGKAAMHTIALEAQEGVRLRTDLDGYAHAQGFRLTEKVVTLPGSNQAQFERVRHCLHSLSNLFPGKGDMDAVPFDDLRDWAMSLIQEETKALKIPRAREIARQFKDLGLQDFLGAIRVRPSAGWPDDLRSTWYHSLWRQCRTSTTYLNEFQGRAHDRIVEEFTQLEGARMRHATARILRAHGQKAIEAMNKFPVQADFVRKEAHRKRPRALRSLLADAPDVLLSAFPCWMASPLTVSQLLGPSESYFDLVLFDEASQIQPEDAIPSILRAKRVVVAGDIHQLPPSPFFADNTLEDESDLASAGHESLLQMVAGMLPGTGSSAGWFLEWHYRSKDESLIAFSNAEIYDHRMITLPQPALPGAVQFVHTPPARLTDHGQESQSTEAIKVVDLILEHAATRPTKTLGVIALGLDHAKRLDALLEKRLETRPELQAFFREGGKEPFFIKNLERVQGDERDEIILSIGYGQDRTGTVSHNFGPINVEGGHRRLNVAVTRAKERMTTVCSFLPEELDPNRTKGQGPKLLRKYLEFAASGGVAYGNHGEQEIPENPFEMDIREALEAKGMNLIPQFGVSRYRLDLVVQHPELPGRFVMAIECDGASYHSAPSARDRDRLRQEHLERMGWHFHRIWSTDWFMNRDEEIARAVAAYGKALRSPVVLEAPPKAEPMEPKIVQLNATRGVPPRIPKQDNITDYSDRSLIQAVEWVLSDGRLLTDDEVIRETAAFLGFSRVGARIRGTLGEIISMVKSRRA